MGIFCLDPRRIAISGKVRVFALDKTGTLTQPWLDLLGVQPVRSPTSHGTGKFNRRGRSTRMCWLTTCASLLSQQQEQQNNNDDDDNDDNDDITTTTTTIISIIIIIIILINNNK